MDAQIPRYAILRSGLTWEGITTASLQKTPDGALTLARVPGPSDGRDIEIAGPYDVATSGLAVGACHDLYIADTAGQHVLWIDGMCGARVVMPSSGSGGSAPGHFNAPRGLLVGPPGGLYVADSGNGRVQVLRLPTLEVHAIWEGPLQTPTGLASDSQERVYVLDRGRHQVLRFTPWGIPDAAYNATLAGQPGLTSPAFLTIAADDTLYVADDADDAANVVLRFNADGHALGSVPAPETATPWRPRALVAHGERLYIADVASGQIWVFDRSTECYLGIVAGYRGPVTTLAIDHGGTLFVKSGLDETIHRLEGDSGCVSSGELVAGPFDAGEHAGWMRLHVDAECPTGTVLQLQTFATDDPNAAPSAMDWMPAPALDTLIPPPSVSGDGPSHLWRYLWLRLTLTSTDHRASPRLLQVQAETAGEDYLSYLPAIYRREDAAHGFLQRWLTLFRAELGDLEFMLDDMARRFDPATTPEDHLPWLAAWLAFALPPGKNAEELRSLLLDVQQLYNRRGTLFGLCQFVHLYTGVQPLLLEAFQERRVWQLGHTSALGFDTALAPAAPYGMVVPDTTRLTDAEHPWGCLEPERLVVGEAVVGQSGPLDIANAGEPLFSDTAHLFTVLVWAAQVPEDSQRHALQQIIEAEKPAHTDYHLCFIEARMRVGFQARIGIDSIIAGPPDPMALSGTVLGLDSVLGTAPGEAETARVGQGARIGRTTIIG